MTCQFFSILGKSTSHSPLSLLSPFLFGFCVKWQPPTTAVYCFYTASSSVLFHLKEVSIKVSGASVIHNQPMKLIETKNEHQQPSFTSLSTYRSTVQQSTILFSSPGHAFVICDLFMFASMAQAREYRSTFIL